MSKEIKDTEKSFLDEIVNTINKKQACLQDTDPVEENDIVLGKLDDVEISFNFLRKKHKTILKDLMRDASNLLSSKKPLDIYEVRCVDLLIKYADLSNLRADIATMLLKEHIVSRMMKRLPVSSSSVSDKYFSKLRVRDGDYIVYAK